MEAPIGETSHSGDDPCALWGPGPIALEVESPECRSSPDSPNFLVSELLFRADFGGDIPTHHL